MLLIECKHKIMEIMNLTTDWIYLKGIMFLVALIAGIVIYKLRKNDHTGLGVFIFSMIIVAYNSSDEALWLNWGIWVLGIFLGYSLKKKAL